MCVMKTLQTILATTLLLVSFSAHAASCPDGSEQIKTTSEDGSYYVYKCEDNDAVSESTSDAQKDFINELIKSGKVTILAASDVSQTSINTTKKWLDLAGSAWFNEDAPASNYYYPILLTIVGGSMDPAIELEDRLCLEIKENFSNAYRHSRCNTNNRDPNCEFGVCYITEYVTDGGASISSSRVNDGFHLMIMSAKWPGPDEEDYKSITLHESFHIYQLSHITTKDRDLFEEKSGRRSGDHNRDVPWWSEGAAEYMAQLLYSKQPGVRPNYLKQIMGDKLGYFGSGQAPLIEEYFKSGERLYNFDYGENGHLAYSIGPWFVAYLINDHGEERIFDFYENLDELGFAGSFLKNFGKPYRDYVDDFDVFFKQPISKILTIIP